jgi:hypothetical protein
LPRDNGITAADEVAEVTGSFAAPCFSSYQAPAEAAASVRLIRGVPP